MRISPLLIVLLVFSTLVIAGCGEQKSLPETKNASATEDAVVNIDSAVNDVDSGMIPENSDVQIGEMI